MFVIAAMLTNTNKCLFSCLSDELSKLQDGSYRKTWSCTSILSLSNEYFIIR